MRDTYLTTVVMVASTDSTVAAATGFRAFGTERSYGRRLSEIIENSPDGGLCKWPNVPQAEWVQNTIVLRCKDGT